MNRPRFAEADASENDSGPIPLGYHSGRYYTTPYVTSTGQAIVANVLYAVPIQIECGVTVGQLSTYITNGLAGANCEYGIYGNDGEGKPGTLILDAGHASAGGPPGSAGVSGLSTQLAPGLDFLVVGCSGAVSLQSASTPGNLLGGLIGLTSQTNSSEVEASPPGLWTYGAALPSPFGAVNYIVGMTPLVFLTPP
jgi:hypothetical protein